MTDPAPRALFPDEAPSPVAPRRRGTSLKGAVDVLVDRSGRIGPLSYVIPEGLFVQRGDAVKVPFGKRESYGLVLGPGDSSRATRPITEVYGKRVTAQELDFAAKVAREHFCSLPTIAARLAPRDGKGAPAAHAGDVVLEKIKAPYGLMTISAAMSRRLLVCAPLVDQEHAAALEAKRLSESGQVLVLCPTSDSAERVASLFQSGAARLGTGAPDGSWKGFGDGTVRVGVGTRTAALYSAENLSGIVVVEEDHPGHKERSQPYTNARDLAISRSITFGCALTLLSSCPTPRALGGKLKAFSVGSPADWPEIKVVNTQNDDPMAPLPQSVQRLVAKRDALMVVEPAPAFVCRRCGSLRCDVGSNESCPHCGEASVRQVNWDTKRASSAMSDLRTCTADELQEETANTIVLPDFEGLLRRPSLLPESWAAHMAVRACRSAGRKGRVVLMVRSSDHPLLKDLTERDLMSQARRSWETAKQTGLAPFDLWVRITVGTKSAPRIASPPGRVVGPRRVGDQWELILQAPKSRHAEVEALVARIRRRGKARIEVL